MTSGPHVLTIDLGTSGVKAAIVSPDAALVGTGHRVVTTEFTGDHGAEQDPDAVWTAAVEACRDALAAAGDASRAVVAVIPTGQYSSIVPVDADGRAVAPMRTWMDQRGTPKAVRALPGTPMILDTPAALARFLRIHGLAPVEGGMSLNHMRAIRFGAPDVYERTSAFLEPVDYLALRLSGRATANQCSAFMSLVVDNRTSGATAYHPDLVADSMIDADKFPELVAVGETLGPLTGTAAADLGLGDHVVVLSGANDSQVGSIAAGTEFGDHAGLSVGTTGVILARIPNKKTNPVHSLFTMPGLYGGNLLSAENGTAGVGVDHFLRNVVYRDDPFVTHDPTLDPYAAFNAAAAEADIGSAGVVYLPWLRGSLAPKADRRMRGGFVNVGLDTTRSDLARAVFEGIAFNLRRLFGPVGRFAGRSLDHAVIYGGGANSDLWCQIMSDVLDIPIRRLATPSQAISLGAGMFALERLGHLTRSELAGVIPLDRDFEPNPAAAARYAEVAGHFDALFGEIRPWFHRINSR